MNARIANLVVRSAAVAGLSAALAFGSGIAGEDHADWDNYFVRHPGPASGRTGIDANDPFAPVDLSGSGSRIDGTGNARVAGTGSAASEGSVEEWSSSPRLPGQPY